ncbi:MAG: hypothetical protein ACLQGP_05440 [Isosphaeraceae bacterium]
MILGAIEDDGVPVVIISVAGRSWPAIIDTGFDGDLELPTGLLPSVNARYLCQIRSFLGAGLTAEEDAYLVDFTFDGQTYSAEATFVARDEILIGTHLLRDHLLEVDFPARKVRMERAN